MPKQVKLPKSLAACADLLFTTKAERLTVQKKVDKLEELEKQIKQHLIDNLPKGDAGGIQGKLARVSIVTKQKPTVEDWEGLWKYIMKNKAYDLLQRRLNEQAVVDRWENNKVIAGVGKFTAVTVSMNKV